MTFMVFAGKFNAPVLVNFMHRLLNQIEGNVYLIVDRNPVHKSSQAKRFLAKNTKRLRLILLRGIAPNSIPMNCPTKL